MKERIQKILAALGVDSRRAIEEMVRQGRICVNGKTVYTLPVMVGPDDKIEVDGELIKRPKTRRESERVYILLNKPKRVYSTNVAQGEQVRAIDLLPPGLPRLFPVGRLDSEAHGLLLLTNDGDLTHQLTHPRFGVRKVYRITVDGYVDDATLESIRKAAGGARVDVRKRMTERSILDLIMAEGRNIQLRPMLAAAGHRLRDLLRVQFGTLKLEKLQTGAYRFLHPAEVHALRKSVTKDGKIQKHLPQMKSDDYKE